MMNRILCFLLLASSGSTAGVISLSATASCPDGVSGGNGSSYAFCGGPAGAGSGRATVYGIQDIAAVGGVPVSGAPFLFDLEVSAGGGDDRTVPGRWSASASFQSDYLLTFTGGSGSGFYTACMKSTADYYPGSGGGHSQGTFGGSFAAASGKEHFDSCSSPSLTPFSFGVPMSVSASFSASAGSGAGSAGSASIYLYGFRLVDGAGNPLTGNFELDPQATPEPGSAGLALAGLALLWAGTTRRRTRQL